MALSLADARTVLALRPGALSHEAVGFHLRLTISATRARIGPLGRRPPAMRDCPESGYALRSVRDQREQEIGTPSILGKPLSVRGHCTRDGYPGTSADPCDLAWRTGFRSRAQS